MKVDGSPKNKKQARNFDFTAEITDNAKIKVLNYTKQGWMTVKVRKIKKNRPYTITFRVNGKEDSVTLDSIVPPCDLTVLEDPRLNEYEQKDIAINVTGISLGNFGCNFDGPGHINNYEELPTKDGLLVTMIEADDNNEPLFNDDGEE